MRESVVEYIAIHAHKQPDVAAVIAEGRITNYKTLWNYIRGFSTFLQEVGSVKKGDRVVVMASQSLSFAICYFATHLAGGIFVPTERNLNIEGLERIIKSVEPKVLIVNELNDVKIFESLTLSMRQIVDISDAYFSENATFTFPVMRDSSDILFTTGTTGSSKGVELAHKTLVATAENLIYGLEMKSDTCILVPGPLNHANPIRKLFTTMVNGSTIVILNGMTNVKAFFDALNHVNGTAACCLPPAAIRTLFQITGDKLKDYADRIDFIESATAPLPEPDKIRLGQLLPKTRLYNNYGSSESASVCMYDYSHYPGKENCVGKAMPNSHILIVNDNKEEINSSKEHMGLLACQGDVNMKGYWREPELTNQVLQNGIVYTSDIGYIDSDGFIYVMGRKGDVINVGGLKVSPTEVEAAALGYDDINDCICVPVEDKITGNAVKLCVVLKPGVSLDPRRIRNYLKSRIENYKLPKYIETIEKVPRTYNGKIDRKKLI